MTMSTKINVPVLAALLVIGVAVPGPASAQTFGNGWNRSGSRTQIQQQLQRLRKQLPSNAFGSAAGSAAVPHSLVSPRGRPFETDPDPNVRFEMNRDDRDRRAGG
jgi:hypothetical protein